MTAGMQATSQLTSKYETSNEEPVTIAIKVQSPPLTPNGRAVLDDLMQQQVRALERALDNDFSRLQPRLDGFADVLGEGIESVTVSTPGRSVTLERGDIDGR